MDEKITKALHGPQGVSHRVRDRAIAAELLEQVVLLVRKSETQSRHKERAHVEDRPHGHLRQPLAGALSDIDVCLVLAPDATTRRAVTRKRLEHLSESDLDLAIFQQLPLQVRSRLLKEGLVLFTRDEDALYALACSTARAFEHFRNIQRQYLEDVARG